MVSIQIVKPRIRYVSFLKFWLCTGYHPDKHHGYTGGGTTPVKAYFDWLKG